MKKKLSLCFTLLIASLLAIICAFKFSPSSRDSKPEDTSDLKRTNFVNRLAPSQDFALQLFYANAGMSQIESFTLTSNTLTKDMVKLSPYSEGFLPQSKNDRLLKAVNAIRTTKKQRALSYFYHYQELGDYAFVSDRKSVV